MRILLLILLIGGCVSQPRRLKAQPKPEPYNMSMVQRHQIMRAILEHLNKDAFLKRGLLYMPPEE